MHRNAMKKNDLCRQSIPHLQYIFLEETLINFKNGCIFNHFCINTLLLLFCSVQNVYFYTHIVLVHGERTVNIIVVNVQCTYYGKKSNVSVCLTNTRKIFGGKYFFNVYMCVCM